MHVPGNYPIMTFKDDRELYECMLWWKERLFLNDWVIHTALKDKVVLGDEEVAGSNEFQILHMASVILISNKQKGDDSSTVCRTCQESTLVHELLHLRLNWLIAPHTHEGSYYEELEHQKIEQFARSLIMAKYRLPLSWWDNDEAVKNV